jgi:hypothetical protein
VIALATTITSSWGGVMAGITKKRNLNPGGGDLAYPRVVKQARHNSCRLKGPGHRGTRRPDPVSLRRLTLGQKAK